MAKKRTSTVVPDRFLICPGSGITHAQVHLPLQQGPKVRFVRCPISGCDLKLFLNGKAWNGDDVGTSRDVIQRANPAAIILAVKEPA